jgi:hypothetical protein
MKQLRLPLGGGNQLVTQPDGFAHERKCVAICHSVKGWLDPI